MRSLICEPDAVSARFFARALTNAGFQVTSCHTAAACEDAMSTDQPSVLVLALLLPDMDGLALLRRLRSRGEAAGAQAVVIMVSALHAELRALQAGADAFLHKPVAASRLSAIARELLSRREAGEGGGYGEAARAPEEAAAAGNTSGHRSTR